MAQPQASSKIKHFKMSKLKLFLLALSCSYVTKSLALSYSRSMITQIERRFNIPSSLVGVIDGSFDIGNLLVIAFVSYFGAKFHRPRVMAVGCLIMVLGGCMTALPHFIMRRYQYEKTLSVSSNYTSQEPLCLTNRTSQSELSEDCESGSESLMWIFVLVGNIMQGIGETPIEPLGLSYVDDFAKVENSPFYIGIIQTVSIAGPFLGSLMAAFFAQIYVDVGFMNLDAVTIGLTDARWVGAWWLGFLVSAVLNLLAAIPFFFFPKSLPKEGEEDRPKTQEMLEPLREEKNENNADRNQKRNEFLQFLKNLCRNKVYVLFLVVTVVQFSAFIGFISFMPKYIEQQYGKSASEAIFLISVYNLPVICIGYFLGGYFMKRFKVTMFLAAKIGFSSSVLEYLIYFSAFAMVCKSSAVAGLTVTYDGVEQVSHFDRLKADCNFNCDCPTDIWDPVCGDNGLSYVSACLAGCNYSTGSRHNTVFQNCSCVSAFSAPSNASAVPGLCAREERCDTMLLYFLIMSLICCLIYSFEAMPGYMVLIRSLTPEEKAFGLGLHLLAARALGGIPSPIYYGALIDTTCIKWGTTSCGEPGACRMYNADSYRHIYLGVPSALRFISYIPCLFILTSLKRGASCAENAVTETKPQETDV